MRRDHREELATAVERFLANIQRLARAALQRQRGRFMGTVPPSRTPTRQTAPARTAATDPKAKPKPKPAVTRVAKGQPRKAVANTEQKRPRTAAKRQPRQPTTNVERTRPRSATVEAVEAVRVAATVRAAPALGTPPTPGPSAPPIVEPAAPPPITPSAPTTTAPAAPSSRCRGTVKWFDAGKGYGFIRGDDGQDAFVHHSAVTEAGFRAFNQGQVVEYDVLRTPKGLQAVALRPG